MSLWPTQPQHAGITLSYASRRFALLDPNLLALGRSHRLALAAVGLSERQIISRAERDGNDWSRPASLFPRMIASAIVLRSRHAGRRRGNVYGDPQGAMSATARAARKGQVGEGSKRTPAAGRQDRARSRPWDRVSAPRTTANWPFSLLRSCRRDGPTGCPFPRRRVAPPLQ